MLCPYCQNLCNRMSQKYRKQLSTFTISLLQDCLKTFTVTFHFIMEILNVSEVTIEAFVVLSI